MSTIKRVAVVTGSNKGIGLSIVRGLCKSFQGDVFLTARDEGRGTAAVEALKSEGLSPKFHQLDISNHGSITKFRDFLKNQYDGLDVLVNNAAILYYDDVPLTLAEQVKNTIQVNYFDNLDVCQVLFPLLRPHARVVNMSSGAGRAAYRLLPAETKKKFQNPNISMEELSNLMSQYSDAGQRGKLDEEGFEMKSEPMLPGLPAVKSDNGMGVYSYSKIGINVMTALQQKQLDKDGPEGVLVNCCTPGFVNTDMTHGNGTLSAEEGAVTPVYLCLLPSKVDTPRGLFIRNKEVEDWLAD